MRDNTILLIICITLLNFFNLSFCGIVNLTLTKNNYNLYNVYTCIGHPAKCKGLILSYVKENITLTKAFGYSDSTTTRIIEETKNQREVTDQIMLRSSGLTETYMMNDVTIIELFESSRKSGFFGLGYSRDSKHQSTLLNRLFTLANKKKVFYIDSDKNILSIGDYPQKFYELKSNGYKIKQCNLIFDYSPIQNDGYRCKVDSIYFKLNSSNKYFHYIINQEISFSPGANLIYVPIDIMDTLANDFLPKSIYEQCEYIQEQQRFVRCNTDFDPSQLKELKPISFVFNSFSINIPPSDLFDTIDGNKYFMFANNRLQQKYWKFGYPLLKHNLIAFDLEDNVISFIPKQ